MISGYLLQFSPKSVVKVGFRQRSYISQGFQLNRAYSLNLQFHITNPRKSFQMNPKSLQILVQSPDLGISLQPTTKHETLSDLKHSLFPQSHRSFYFTFNGKPLPDKTPLSQFPPLSTLSLRSRLPGGGGDGGATGAESRDCYLNMYADKML